MKRQMIAVAMLTALSCAPKPETMHVLYVEGFSSSGVVPGTWEPGEIKYCEVGHDEITGGDVLLCGPSASMAWEDAGRAKPEQARQFRLKIGSYGRLFPVRMRDRTAKPWICRRTADDGLSCHSAGER